MKNKISSKYSISLISASSRMVFISLDSNVVFTMSSKYPVTMSLLNDYFSGTYNEGDFFKKIHKELPSEKEYSLFVKEFHLTILLLEESGVIKKSISLASENKKIEYSGLILTLETFDLSNAEAMANAPACSSGNGTAGSDVCWHHNQYSYIGDPYTVVCPTVIGTC